MSSNPNYGNPDHHIHRFLTDDYRLALDADQNMLMTVSGDSLCRQCGCFRRCLCPEGLAETYQIAARVEVWEDLVESPENGPAGSFARGGRPDRPTDLPGSVSAPTFFEREGSDDLGKFDLPEFLR